MQAMQATAVAPSKKRACDGAASQPCSKKAKEAAQPGLVTAATLSHQGFVYPPLPMGMPYCFPTANPFFNPFMFPFWLPGALAAGSCMTPAGMPFGMGAGSMMAASALPAAPATSTSGSAATSCCPQQQQQTAMPGFPQYMFPNPMMALQQQQQQLQQQFAPSVAAPGCPQAMACSMPSASSFSGISCSTVATTCSNVPSAPCGSAEPSYANTAPAPANSPPPMASSPGSVCNGSSVAGHPAEDDEFATFIDNFLHAGDLVDVSLPEDGPLQLLDASDLTGAPAGLARQDSLLSLLGSEF